MDIVCILLALSELGLLTLHLSALVGGGHPGRCTLARAINDTDVYDIPLVAVLVDLSVANVGHHGSMREAV